MEQSTPVLPPAPPVIPSNFLPMKVAESNRRPMTSRELGSKGQRIPLLTNHFNVQLNKTTDDYFFQYTVALFYEDGNPVETKGIGRKILDMVHKTYQSEMGGKGFAYDGEKTLFTVGPLPGTKLEFPVVLESIASNRTTRGGSPSTDGETKRSRRVPQSKEFKVTLSYATEIPIQAIFNALRGQESEQNVRHVREIDWVKAKRMLKNLRIKTFPSNLEYKIIGLSEKTCRHQRFSMKQKGQGGNSPREAIEITVLQYYSEKGTRIEYSADCPCLDVGKPKKPVYIPLELCELISLQRYTKSLSNLQRASLVEKSRQKPRDRMRALEGALNQSNYNADPLINSTGITISTMFTEVEGRVLAPPRLKFGRGGDMVPRDGRWNFNNKTLVEPKQISSWVVVNFSSGCDVVTLRNRLRVCSQEKGIKIDAPYKDIIFEKGQFRSSPALVRVEKMLEEIQKRVPDRPNFILCILPALQVSHLLGKF